MTSFRKTKNLLTAMIGLFAVALVLAGCGGGGGGGGVAPAPDDRTDETAPTLSVATPASGSCVSDVDFRATQFYIQISYADASLMDDSTLSVTLKMDSDAAQNITSYFSVVNSSTIRSSNLYQFTRTLFVLPSNTQQRTMTVSASISDASGNTGTKTSLFYVYPEAPPDAGATTCP